MFVLNKQQIEKKLNSRSKKLDKIALQEALVIFREKKDELIDNLNNHEISQELKGAASSDGSDFLEGRSGNLRAFIGFEPSDNPVEDLINILQSSIRLSYFPNAIEKRNEILYKFPLFLPTLNEIYEQTPYPDHHTGGSWVRGVHQGMSSLNYYLFSTSKNFKGKSRSGSAIQSKYIVKESPSSTNGRKYIDELLRNFKNNSNTI